MKAYCIYILSLLAIGGCTQEKVAFNGQQNKGRSITEAQSKIIYAESKDFPNNTQLSLALIKNGTAQFYGIKRKNDTIVTIDNHDGVFEIGSISKVFTATLLADLVVDHQLELEDHINDFLDWPLKDNVKITFKQLSNHTSGLPRLPGNLLPDSVDLQNPYKDYDELKLKQYLAQELALNHDPGEKSEYSNLGVGLLGYILSGMDNTSYEDLLQTKICTKYEMASTTTDRNSIKNKLIRGLDTDGNETPNWDLNVLVGAGGIVSSVADLSKFAQAQFNDSDEILALTRKPTYGLQTNNAGMGLGWAIKKTPVGEQLMHGGGTGGYRSNIIIDMAHRTGVVILSNVTAFHKYSINIDNLSVRLLETLNKTDSTAIK